MRITQRSDHQKHSQYALVLVLKCWKILGYLLTHFKLLA